MRIYAVENWGCVWWMRAGSEQAAIENLVTHLKDVGQWEEVSDDAIFSAEEVAMNKELTFCADIKGIVHTAEDWLIIYDHCDDKIPLACSEF